MTAVVSLLRGVNVGGHHKIPMQELRALYESLGLRNARTHIQSGNVIFTSGDRDMTRLGSLIENGIEKRFGFRCDVMLRTASEMAGIIASNPFAERIDLHPSKLLVVFLARDPGPEGRAKFLQIPADPEELRANGRELYIYYPNGMGRSKLSGAVVERALKIPGTARNWNTVMKLAELAQEASRS